MRDKGKLAVGALIFVAGVALGYSIGHYRPRGWTAASGSTATLGPWEATFKVPTSIQFPDRNPVVKLEFRKDPLALLYDEINLTARNLSSRSYTLTYGIYGYNSKGERVSGDFDKFPIGGHESVIRQIMLSTYGSGSSFPGLNPKLRASSFALSVKLEE